MRSPPASGVLCELRDSAGDQFLKHQIPSATMHLSEIIGYSLLLVAALELILGASLVNSVRRRSPVKRSLAAFALFAAAFALFTSISYLRAARGLDPGLFRRLSWIAWLMLPAALQFVLYQRDERSSRARTAGLVLYPFWTAVFLLCIFTDLVETGDTSLLPFVDSRGPFETPLRLFGAVQVIWIMYEGAQLRKQVTGLARTRFDYFFFGNLLFAGGGAVIGSALPLLGGAAVDPALAAYFTLPWISVTFYAVTRHRLTDLRELLSRTAHVALLTGLGIGLHLLLFDLFEPGLGHTGGILASLGVIGLLFFGTGFNHAVAHRLQRSIVGRRNDYRSVLRESITGIARLLDLDELLGFIITSIRKSLDIDAVRLYLRAHDGAYVLRQGYDAHERIAPPWELVPDAARWIEERKTAVIGEELESEDNGKGFIVQYLRDIDAAVALPLFSKDRMIGVLTLGEKQGGAPYAPGDIDLLETLSGHAAVAIENALLYDRMEERVRERTQELEEARRIAEEANRAKSQFLSNISHELRTPLNAIIGFSEIMKDGAAGPLTPDQQAYSRDIWESGKHLLRIINNLLDLSKIEAGMMTLDPDEFSLKELLEGCLGLFRDRARQRGLTLRAEVGEECDLVTADRTKIKQVALNLIANAVKFTPDGGTIIVSARRLPAAGGTGGAFEVTVADTGIGMTTEEQGRLFRPFVQLDNSLTKKYEGTGLGLHLSSRIIGMHGGAIRVESEPGKGSAFSFSVPQP